MTTSRERFYIQFSYWNPATEAFDKGVWPMLFASHDAAVAHATDCNPFQNIARLPNRGRIKSFTVEKVTLAHDIPA